MRTLANSIVLRTLEIISYLDPNYWVIENPQTGLLKNQYFMNDIPYNDVDYCKYGMPYRKRTRLWNNIPNFIPLPLCNKDCNSMIGNRHISTGQHDSNSTKDLYVIPSPLILDVFNSIHLRFHLCTHLPTHLPTYILLTYLPTYIRTDLPTFLHTYSPTYVPAHLPTYLLTYLPTYLPTCLPTCLLAYLHTYLHTYRATYFPTYSPSSRHFPTYLPIYIPI